MSEEAPQTSYNFLTRYNILGFLSCKKVFSPQTSPLTHSLTGKRCSFSDQIMLSCPPI